MIRTLALASILALAACGDSTPPPKPVVQPVTPQAQVAEAPKAPESTKAPEAPKADPNKELAQRVKQAIDSDGKVQPGAIDVTAKDGRVSLWGTAATAGERNRAAQIATKVDGVASVDNQIKIVKGS
jgi:hyperosmotically inducible periplasmic protein